MWPCCCRSGARPIRTTIGRFEASPARATRMTEFKDVERELAGFRRRLVAVGLVVMLQAYVYPFTLMVP